METILFFGGLIVFEKSCSPNYSAKISVCDRTRLATGKSASITSLRQFVEPQMTILFGSYAHGDWVEDIDKDTLEFRYQSGFDLLVVMETCQQASHLEKMTA